MKMSTKSQKMQTTTTSSHEPTRRRLTKSTPEKKIAPDEFMAAAIGDVEWLKQSLKDKESVIYYDKNGLAAIHIAAIHCRLDCLKTCIEEFKMDVNLPSSTGWRAVHLCISNQTGTRSLDCLTYLIKMGAHCLVANDDGITPAHQASSEGLVDCLKLLLKANVNLDCKDSRGNTPLDLAKLWGHRKCARILAAEMWHQDKSYEAKEMQQLKKVKMQQVLKDYEEEEKYKEIKQLYGDEAFTQWMTNKNLALQSVEQVLKHSRETSHESLHQENSVSKTNMEIEHKKTTHISSSDEKNKKNGCQKNVIENKTYKKAVKDHAKDSNMRPQLKKPEKKKKYTTVHHVSQWNISAKTLPSKYVPNLDDDIPRDQYTKMPLVQGAPKFFEGKFKYPLTADIVDEDIKKMGTTTKLRRPNLPKKVIISALSKDSSLSDRGMIFKCKHVEDVQVKKGSDVDMRCSETPLHLTNDVNSYLVKYNIRLAQDNSLKKVNAGSNE